MSSRSTKPAVGPSCQQVDPEPTIFSYRRDFRSYERESRRLHKEWKYGKKKAKKKVPTKIRHRIKVGKGVLCRVDKTNNNQVGKGVQIPSDERVAVRFRPSRKKAGRRGSRSRSRPPV